MKNNLAFTLSPAQSDALHADLMALLAAQARRYTQGAGGSLPKETANELLVSILYTLAVDPTKPERFSPLVGKDIFAYDAVFFPHHVPGDIDYQLCLPVPESLMGVDYALCYLQRLSLESELLVCFPVHRVLALLDGVSARWRALVCNLLTPVLENAMALALLNKPPRRLHVSGDDRAALLTLFHGKTQGELERLFDRAAVYLAQTLIPNRTDARLLCQTLAKQLAPRVFEAARREDLSHVFFSFGLPRRVTSCSKG